MNTRRSDGEANGKSEIEVKRSKMDGEPPKATHVFTQEHRVTREHRGRLLSRSSFSAPAQGSSSQADDVPSPRNRFCGGTIWLTGLSGAGKTTIGFALEEYLVSKGVFCYGLDGDNIRKGLCSDLGFSEEERNENIRRVTEVSKLFADSGAVAICSFVSPFKKHRDFPRQVHETANLPFLEVFIDTPLDVCEERDVKGLYKMAREGKIRGFTGIDQPYERPDNPELVVKTVKSDVGECVCLILRAMTAAAMIPFSVYEEAAEWYHAKSSTAAGSVHKEIWQEKVPELFVRPEERAAVLAESETLAKVTVSRVDLEWMQVLAEGWAAPVKGFMRETQFLQSLHFNCLFDGGDLAKKKQNRVITNQSMPIVLAISTDDKVRVEAEKSVALVYDGRAVAILRSPEFYPHRKEERCCRTFGTSDPNHPTIRMIMESGDWLMGGELEVVDRIRWGDGLDDYRKTPNELRDLFLSRGTDAVFAFQLRNPVHNGHALLMSDCREQLLKKGFKNPILLLHPLGGWTKDDDVPLDVRMRQHQAVLESGVLDPKSTVIAIFPSPMSYAGPTEVQWHARARTAAGANFYIVGRDPAGLPKPDGSGVDLYDAEHGAKVLGMAPGLEELEIMTFKVAAYDKVAGAMAFFDPKRSGDFLKISGTEMRRLARAGETPPEGFMAKPAWDVLAGFYRGLVGQPPK